MNMWNSISSEQDLSILMSTVCAFHDSCIKEIKYTSGAYVDNDLTMYPVNDLRALKMIIQRQFDNPSAIELEFLGLKYFRLSTCDEQYTCELHDATMLLKDGYVFWCDCGGLTVAELEQYSGTIVCASKLRWRAVNEYIGAKEVYKSI